MSPRISLIRQKVQSNPENDWKRWGFMGMRTGKNGGIPSFFNWKRLDSSPSSLVLLSSPQRLLF